jgi:PAS domain S-box-containing protein
VQFYESDSYLCERVGEFIWVGLGAGQPLIIIATHDHVMALRQYLTGKFMSTDRAIADGLMTFLDAEATLGQISVDGTPSWPLFERHVGSLVRAVRAAHGERPIRAYGEMVNVLWQRGRSSAALALEEMWNKLAAHEEFSLLCGYSLDNFSSSDDVAGFRAVCGTHSHVVPSEGFSALDSADSQLREIGALQQRARALDAEIQRRTAVERELREREEELRDFIENGVECMHRVGPDGTILFANDAELKLLGYQREEYLGRDIREFYVDDAVIEDIFVRLTRGETLRNCEARLRCKDGSIKDVLIHSNVYWRDGAFIHTRCFSRDITERKQMERELSAARSQLESTVRELEMASRMKDDFLATVSHELRTPLNAILGWTKLVRGGGLSAGKRERALETIERNASAQARLIEELLDVSRIISGQIRLDRGNVELGAVVENALEAIRPAADAKGVTLAFCAAPGASLVVGDAQRLQQVVWNLVANAVKFTPRDGTVNIAIGRKEAAFDIVVSDDGQGIAVDFLPHIFERFRQADASPSRKHGGLGLGLAIVRHIVELHGGTVKAESDGPGQGATFTVRLPAPLSADVLLEPLPAPASLPLSNLEGFHELEGIHILVVDDEPDSSALACEVLSACGATVSTAANVDEALEQVRQSRPGVIISDIAMPQEDGYSFIAKLRGLSEAAGGRTPAVALTAYSRLEDRTKALLRGFDAHLAKPVEPRELIAVLARLTRP